jgi:two-component system, chemotaxis family, chemotaxis protein CheY
MLPADKRVLVVDDDRQIRHILKSMLIKLGIKKISAAENVDEAKKFLQEAEIENDPYNLILCDHNMPGVSGLDFIVYLRQSLKYKEIPFITITSDSSRTVVLPYITAGSDSFIVKPPVEKDLLAKITQVWTKKGLMK